jgi:alpha-glucosidase (family GH31 glycosyl hydrolase)
LWLIAGNDWYDMAHHQMMKGGTVRTLYYTIDENPWYVRAGAMIPLAAEGISNLQGISPELRLLIVPGNGKSTYIHYEDDGISQQYGTQFATTEFTKLATSSALKLTIAPRKGSYKGAPATRKISLVLEGVKSVKSVKVNGFVLATEPVFKDGALSVVLPEAPVGEKTEVEIIR